MDAALTAATRRRIDVECQLRARLERRIDSEDERARIVTHSGDLKYHLIVPAAVDAKYLLQWRGARIVFAQGVGVGCPSQLELVAGNVAGEREHSRRETTERTTGVRGGDVGEDTRARRHQRQQPRPRARSSIGPPATTAAFGARTHDG